MTVRNMLLCSFFAALTCVISFVRIPIATIPFTLQLIPCFLSGMVLGKRGGAVSQMIYVLLGACGLPVFSGFTGGVGVLLGPTGGFIFSFPVAAYVAGYTKDWFGFGKRVSKKAVGVLGLALVCVYGFGAGWFCFVTQSGLLQAFMVCILPFVWMDLLKIAVCVLVKRTKAISDLT